MVCVRQCCCGCTLAQGTVIIGVLTLIGCLPLLYYGYICVQYEGLPIEGYSQGDINNYGIAFLAVGGITGLCCLLLFAAVSMKNRALVLPWLLVRGILWAGSIVGIIYLSFTEGFILSYYGPPLADALLMLYFFMVVISWYQTTTGEDDVVYTNGQYTNGQYTNGNYMGGNNRMYTNEYY